MKVCIILECKGIREYGSTMQIRQLWRQHKHHGSENSQQESLFKGKYQPGSGKTQTTGELVFMVLHPLKELWHEKSVENYINGPGVARCGCGGIYDGLYHYIRKYI